MCRSNFDVVPSGLLRRCHALIVGFLLLSTGAASAQPAPEDVFSGVVYIKTIANPDASTADNLGREREGTGIVIDNDGLVLTIGYLMVEAYAAEIRTNDNRTVPASIVGYDHETGFGLLRAVLPLKVRPVPFGKSAELKTGDKVMVASFGGARMAAPARVLARREFAGSWEYLLDDAIFTSPPHMAWSGAALLDRDGNLVGVGSLILSDAAGSGVPGNMFVPIDRLPPILSDLLAQGRPAGPARPWLGLTTNQIGDRLLVGKVAPRGPAEKAGIKSGDLIVGVDGASARSLPDFYRKVWANREAGATVPLDLERDGQMRHVDVTSGNRMDYLKLKSTF